MYFYIFQISTTISTLKIHNKFTNYYYLIINLSLMEKDHQF